MTFAVKAVEESLSLVPSSVALETLSTVTAVVISTVVSACRRLALKMTALAMTS